MGHAYSPVGSDRCVFLMFGILLFIGTCSGAAFGNLTISEAIVGFSLAAAWGLADYFELWDGDA